MQSRTSGPSFSKHFTVIRIKVICSHKCDVSRTANCYNIASDLLSRISKNVQSIWRHAACDVHAWKCRLRPVHGAEGEVSSSNLLQPLNGASARPHILTVWCPYKSGWWVGRWTVAEGPLKDYRLLHLSCVSLSWFWLPISGEGQRGALFSQYERREGL